MTGCPFWLSHFDTLDALWTNPTTRRDRDLLPCRRTSESQNAMYAASTLYPLLVRSAQIYLLWDKLPELRSMPPFQQVKPARSVRRNRSSVSKRLIPGRPVPAGTRLRRLCASSSPPSLLVSRGAPCVACSSASADHGHIPPSVTTCRHCAIPA